MLLFYTGDMNYLAYNPTSSPHTGQSGSSLHGFIFLVAVVILLFEIRMIIDCILNKNIPALHKAFWIVGMLLIPLIVAVVYFFASSSSHNKLP